MTTALSLPKHFYEIHFKDGSRETIALDNPLDRGKAIKEKQVLTFLDTISVIDTSGISRVKEIKQNSRTGESSKAYLEKLSGPLQAVGELRLQKYEKSFNRPMPLQDFKDWMTKFISKREKREREGDEVYAPCYRMNGGK